MAAKRTSTDDSANTRNAVRSLVEFSDRIAQRDSSNMDDAAITSMIQNIAEVVSQGHSNTFAELLTFVMEERLPTLFQNTDSIIDLKDETPTDRLWKSSKDKNGKVVKQTYTLSGIPLVIERIGLPGIPVHYKGYVDGEYLVRGESRELVRQMTTALARLQALRSGPNPA